MKVHFVCLLAVHFIGLKNRLLVSAKEPQEGVTAGLNGDDAKESRQYGCAGFAIDVKYGSSQTTNNLSPVSYPMSLSSFYGWTQTAPYFKDTGLLPLGGYKSVLFVYEDQYTCQRSLVLVNSKPGFGSADRNRNLASLLFKSNDYQISQMSNPTVQDDPTTFDPDCKYQYTAFTDSVTMQWKWSLASTDGFGHELGENFQGCISVSPLIFQEIYSWVFVSGDGAGGTKETALPLNLYGTRVEVCIRDVSRPCFDTCYPCADLCYA